MPRGTKRKAATITAAAAPSRPKRAASAATASTTGAKAAKATAKSAPKPSGRTPAPKRGRPAAAAATAKSTKASKVPKKVTKKAAVAEAPKKVTNAKKAAAPKKVTEKVAVAEAPKNVSKPEKIQIAMSFDTTGSMHPCLGTVKNSIQQTVQRLKAAIPNIEIAIVAHGDYEDARDTYDVTYMDFCTDAQRICDFVKKVKPTCGYDADECYEYALRQARTQLSWDAKANKSLVVIGDAEPHPPNFAGNKFKIDWRDEAKLLRQADVKVYAVKCLNWCKDTFYRNLATITNGHFLELHQLQAITNFMIAISFKEGSGTDDLIAYREEVRGRGQLTRNLRQLFSSLGAAAADDNAEEADLDAVDPCRFQVLDVTEKCSIKEFVEKMGAVFKTGRGFYEYTKAEEVQGYKEIVLMKRSTGDMFTGQKARQLAEIGDHVKGKKMKPPASDKWIMFVQSTSYNRALMPGTKFLYEVQQT